MRRILPLIALPLVLLCASCDGTGGEEEEEEEVTPGEPCTVEGQSQCSGILHQTCVEGHWKDNETCDSPTPQCSVTLGCTGCGPGQDYCVDNAVYSCNSAGTGWAESQDCGDMSCRWGECFDLCSLAAETGSYLGCEFMSAPTANSLLEGFDDDFAVVLGNPDDAREAAIQIGRDGDVITSATLAPLETRAFTLDYDDELKSTAQSVIVRGGAYEILSNIPVVAYQYNPLNFSNGPSYSYTNDASLLLPVAALGQDHLVSTWPSFGIVEAGTWTWSPGFVSVVAAEDGTRVHINAAAYTLDGDVPAMEPGQTTEILLNRGDVVQVFSEKGTTSCGALEGALEGDAVIQSTSFPVCLNVERGDLSGSRVTADRPIAVFAGHDCTFVPFDRWACDHLEESMLPLEVWGTDAVVSAPIMPSGTGNAPTLVRVIAQEDGTELTVTPPIIGPTAVGPYTPVEFRADEDVMVSANRPILVMQFLLGEQELGANAGDPAMGTMPPSNHWRSSYEFLVPSSYESDYVNIVARYGAEVYIDEIQITEWSILEDTPYKVHRARLQRGPHTARSDSGSPFSLVAYGYASYTSYLYPGGLDLTHNPQP